MKNNKIKVILLVCLLMLTTGCGNKNYILDSKKQPVTVQGQVVQKNIFCRPSEGTEMYEVYKKYSKQMDIKLKDLPTCDNFKINSNKTDSLWEFLFVKPLAYLILKLGNVLTGWGLKSTALAISLMLIGLAIRLIILPFNIKTQNQSKKMQEMMPEMQKIERKYANRTDQEAMILKSQETMELYKKYKVSPFLSCLLSLIQLPLFFAFLQAIYKIPTIYEGEIFGLGLGVTPSVGIFDYHQYGFIILVILIILTTYFSFQYTMKQSASANNEAAKQMKTMLIVMTVIISFASFSLPTAIALYWIVTYAFIIIQTFIMNLIQKNKDKKRKSDKKNKSIKDKLKVKEGLKYGKNN